MTQSQLLRELKPSRARTARREVCLKRLASAWQAERHQLVGLLGVDTIVLLVRASDSRGTPLLDLNRTGNP